MVEMAAHILLWCELPQAIEYSSTQRVEMVDMIPIAAISLGRCGGDAGRNNPTNRRYLPEPSFSESFGEFRDIQRLRQTRSSRLSFLRNVADLSRDRIGNGVGRVRRTGSKGNDGIENQFYVKRQYSIRPAPLEPHPHCAQLFSQSSSDGVLTFYGNFATPLSRRLIALFRSVRSCLNKISPFSLPNENIL